MGEEDKNGDDEDEETDFGLIDASIYQAAILNKILPRGFKIELQESVIKNVQLRQNAALNAASNAKRR